MRKIVNFENIIIALTRLIFLGITIWATCRTTTYMQYMYHYKITTARFITILSVVLIGGVLFLCITFVLTKTFVKSLAALLVLVVSLSVIAYNHFDYKSYKLSSYKTRAPLELISKTQEKSFDFLWNIKRDVTIYDYEYFKIIVPTDLDKTKQQVSVDDIIKTLNSLDKELVDLIDEIRLVDYKYTHENAKPGSVTLGQSYVRMNVGVIELYKNDTMKDKLDKKYLITHELGHLYDRKLKNNLGFFSDSIDYNDIVKKDTLLNDEGFVSNYGMTYYNDNKSYVEDFADSFAFYITKKDGFKENFPNRYKFFNQYIKKYMLN